MNGYGLTETSGAATVVRPSDRFSTSVGQPLPGVEIKIATETEETGSLIEGGETRSLRHGETRSPGQILIRGGVVMREYYNRPEATREAIRDGWLHTGDLGFIDAQGRVHITGRLKEIIVLSSGKNLYPEEIESHYRQSAFVKELCVLGLSRPDEPASERLHALVVPDEDVLRARGIVNVRELIRFEIETLSVRLPAHKRILTYDIQLSPLPRTTTGKLKRGEISQLQERRSAPPDDAPALSSEDSSWLETGSRSAWLALIASRLGRSTVTPAANLELDLGLDSMERVELLAFVEEQLGRRVAGTRRAVIFTVRQLIEALEDATERSAESPVGAIAAGSQQSWNAVLAEPAPSILTDPLNRRSDLRGWIIGLGLRLVMLPLRLVMRVEASGLAHLPARGPYLICSNHQSHLDGFLLAATLPVAILRQTFFVGASEYFETPRAARVARFLNIVPVDPDANLVTAMRVAASGLRLRKILVLFPEGERSIDGTVKPFRKGAAILGDQLNVPIIPAAMDGLFAIWPRGRGLNWRALRPWRRACVTIAFGPPIRVTAGDPGQAARHLQAHVIALLPEARADAAPEPAR